MILRCIKSLRKSTYHRNAFTKGKRYEVVREEADILWLKDEMGHEFSFSKEPGGVSYVLGDHFEGHHE